MSPAASDDTILLRPVIGPDVSVIYLHMDTIAQGLRNTTYSSIVLQQNALLSFAFTAFHIAPTGTAPSQRLQRLA